MEYSYSDYHYMPATGEWTNAHTSGTQDNRWWYQFNQDTHSTKKA
jgi:hypothetical protein